MTDHEFALVAGAGLAGAVWVVVLEGALAALYLGIKRVAAFVASRVRAGRA